MDAGSQESCNPCKQCMSLTVFNIVMLYGINKRDYCKEAMQNLHRNVHNLCIITP
jgi:hypothetical protein